MYNLYSILKTLEHDVRTPPPAPLCNILLLSLLLIKAEQGMTEHGNGLCGEEGMRKAEQGMRMTTVRGGEWKGRTWNGENGRTRNDNLPLTALISCRDMMPHNTIK